MKVDKSVFKKAQALMEFNSYAVVADQMGLSITTLSRINRSPSFNKYKGKIKLINLDVKSKKQNKLAKSKISPKISVKPRKNRDINNKLIAANLVLLHKRILKLESESKISAIELEKVLDNTLHKEFNKVSNDMDSLFKTIVDGVKKDLEAVYVAIDSKVSASELHTYIPTDGEENHISKIGWFFIFGAIIGASLVFSYILWRLSL